MKRTIPGSGAAGAAGAAGGAGPSAASGDRVSGDRYEKWLNVAALALSIELVLFKFLPDLSTAVIQHDTSLLTDFARFREYYLTPGSVHYARFLGNETLYSLATLLAGLFHSDDPRLHPLRVAAGILTPVYAYLGAHLVLRNGGTAWRHFMPPYVLAVLMGLYVFYPGDMPALGFLSVALYFLLRERRQYALLFMLVTGLFRETAFHMLAFVAVWACCDRRCSVRDRISWVAVFAIAFCAEYAAIRHFFPGPISSSGGIMFDRRLLLGAGLMSLTTVCSLGLAVLFPIACLLKADCGPPSDWRRRFFVINCWLFPAWIVFYRMMSGNLSEFRLLLPVVLPCIYGIAHAHREAQLGR